MATTAPVIDVIDPSGKRHTVNGRAAEIIAMVLIYQERINVSTGGHFAVHYRSGQRVKPEILDQLEGN